MAEVLLSALLPVVIEKATNYALRQFGMMWGIPEKLEELEGKLLAIQSIIGDAEERQGEDHVKHWLEGLKETAYQADDILDEFNMEVMRLKAGNQAYMMKKVRSFFSFPHSVWFRFQIGRKLNDIIEKINRIKTEGDEFHFNKDTIQPQNRDRPPTYSYVDESAVIGREEDKKKIVKLLLDHDNNHQNVAVLPIVGMGGLGKTTLAQYIYKDERVEKHFQPLIWVCVSEEFEVVKLTKAIITSARKEECNESTMELLQHRLREVLSGKRYFLVLDDVLNNDWEKWDLLKTLLETGTEGSQIIVTTRSEQVASIMGTLPPYYPQHLNENDSWTLFKKRAFKDGVEEPQNLVSIGKDIVKKCDGLPLALKVLGALMYSKSQEAEWLSVKNSEIWNSRAGDEILSVLRLSYRDLPSHLKQCFAFCAIFPKDYEIKKDMLIQLWMANGFIPSDEGKELEDKGNEIFNELVWRSFFQDIKKVEYGGHRYLYQLSYTTCKMHDLMHDLAQSIMGNECLSNLEHVRWEHISKKTHHLYIPPGFQSDSQRTLNNFPNIRTLLMPDPFSRIVTTGDSLKSMPLRALNPRSDNITQLQLNAIRFLKYLRYLDLSFTKIKELPEATGALFNLQTLILSHCRSLRKLPDGMKNMSNLRHLYINGCLSLKCLPTSMGQLRSLRTLTAYIVGNENGRRIDELNGLNLGGSLELYNLKNVRDATEAKKANLSSKHNLCSLKLCWDMVCWRCVYSSQDISSVENATEVLEGLRPHVSLKVLAILRYGGTCLPTWMKDSQLLQNLVEIHLEFCTGCEHLPPLWQSRSLKVLCLKKMDKVKHICSGNESNSTVQTFPSLERLELFNMQSLKAWSENEGTAEAMLVFPRLTELEISYCPNLMTMPGLPSLASLKMEGTDIQLGLMSSLTTLSSLSITIYKMRINTQSPPCSQKNLSFRCFKSLENLTITAFKEEDLALLLEEEETRGLSISLHSLSIENCNGLFSSSQQSSSPLGFWKNLASLRRLEINSCDDLVYLSEEIRGLNSLETLNISYCKNLIGLSSSPSSFSSSGDQELLPKLKHLEIQFCSDLLELPKLPASLRTLYIIDCTKLNSFTEVLQHATALEDITISGCKYLTSLPIDLGHLTALRNLKISYCPLLSSLPEGLQRLPGLRSLLIECCSNLERLCKRGGPYWELVSQIPEFKIISKRSTNSTFLPSVWQPIRVLIRYVR